MYSICEEKSKYTTSIILDNNNEIEKLIENSIKKEDKIEIIYNEVDGTQNKRTIHPLYFFEYKKMKYITAYCELRNDIRHFELKRINIIKQ